MMLWCIWPTGLLGSVSGRNRDVKRDGMFEAAKGGVNLSLLWQQLESDFRPWYQIHKTTLSSATRLLRDLQH